MLPSRPAMDAPKPTGLAPAQPFTRADLERGSPRLLARGRWANAVVNLFEHGGTTWVVKDFRARSFAGAQPDRPLAGAARSAVARPGRRPAGHAAGCVPHRRVRPRLPLRARPQPARQAAVRPAGPSTFRPWNARLRDAARQQAGLAHFDLRNAKNILVTDAGEPLLLDFQSAVGTGWMPGPLRRFAEQVDFAAIYKHWKKRSPETLGPERARGTRPHEPRCARCGRCAGILARRALTANRRN